MLTAIFPPEIPRSLFPSTTQSATCPPRYPAGCGARFRDTRVSSTCGSLPAEIPHVLRSADTRRPREDLRFATSERQSNTLQRGDSASLRLLREWLVSRLDDSEPRRVAL